MLPTRFPLFGLVLFVCTQALTASLRLGSPFTDHAVLQQGQALPVWGWADPGVLVTVGFDGQSKSVVCSSAGTWRVTLPPLQTSAEPRSLTVKAGVESVTLHDVLVGEVWLASGQSNMVFTVSKSRYAWAGVVDEKAEIASARFPQIRMFTVAEQKAYVPCLTVAGEWQLCTPDTVPGWSAVAYFFARELHRELGVPVGIITAAYGASCAQAWLRREVMLDDPGFKTVLDRFDEQVRGRTEPTATELADWERAAELARAEKRRLPRRPGEHPVQDQHNPTVMYNGMIAPLVPYAVRGFLWYQGESITNPRDLFPRWNARLISDWRSLWGGSEKPFLFCQLAALDSNSNSPQTRAWQAEALALPNTGMAVTIDIGDEKDVHPHNKVPVGRRLALLALNRVYARALEDSGPVCVRVTQVGERSLRLDFTHANGGLVTEGEHPLPLEVAGPDGHFFPAKVTIEGNSLIVQCRAVPSPMTARYAWSNYPRGAKLYNKQGLPAAPFVITR